MPALIVLLQALVLAVSGPPTSSEYLPVRVAEAEGYFAAEGLAITVRTTRAESGAAEAVAQGQADLAATTLEAILRFGLRATTSQAPRLVFGLTAAPPVALLVAGPHADAVRSIEDLSAMRVGVTTPGAPEMASSARQGKEWSCTPSSCSRHSAMARRNLAEMHATWTR